MLSAADFERLKSRIASEDPRSWHWHDGKGSIFDTVKDALHKLNRANDPRVHELHAILTAKQSEFLKSGFKDAADAVNQLLGVEKISVQSSGVWSVPDVPIEVYTAVSSENLALPGCIDFALSNGGLLQSAREAVNYRMMKGKDDFNFYYNTRTVAIYYRENNAFFVAFDDSVFDNILLLRAKEGYDARDNWLVNVNDPLVKNAILRAKGAGRTIMVTSENERDDSLAVAKCMIGNKADGYDSFIKKHFNRELKCYVLDNGDCKNVTDGRVLIRLVGLGVDNYYNDDLNAVDRCVNFRRSRGVQKISIGNRGWLVPYIGLIIFQQLGFVKSLEDNNGINGVLAYFQPVEQKLPGKEAKNLFYSGLGAVCGFIKSKEELDKFVQALISIIKSKTNHLGDFFLALFKLKEHGIVLQSSELEFLAIDFSKHNKTLSEPVKLIYWLELRRSNLVNQNLSVSERLKLRNESGFKEYFLKNLFKQRYGVDVDVSDLPFTTLMKMFDCDKITKEIISEAQDAIKKSRKQFPTNKMYYYQTAKGITIQTATPELVQQTLLNLMSITLTQQKRWSAQHDQAAQQVNTLVNNKQKIDDLINFSRSCINQGAAFINIRNLFEDLKGRKQSKEELLKSIDDFFQAIKNNKYNQVDQSMLQRKIEPLNDILVMLKSQLREQETGTAVSIISQKPRITDLMDYDTTHCCAFFPYYNEEGAMDYIEDDNIGLLQYFVMSGKKNLSTIYGVIIFAICEDKNKNTTLLIDSAEGDENMLKIMSHWQEVYHDCIKKLAKDIGTKQIVYGDDAGNTVPREFLKYIAAGKFTKSIFYLTKKGAQKDRYLESFEGDMPKGNVRGYVEQI